MSAGRSGSYLIAYDIRDPRRLVRIHRYLRRHAVPVQYSVFVGRLTGRHLARVTAGIEQIIDARRDDVRIYPLPARCERETLGPELFPKGVLISAPLALPR